MTVSLVRLMVLLMPPANLHAGFFSPAPPAIGDWCRGAHLPRFGMQDLSTAVLSTLDRALICARISRHQVTVRKCYKVMWKIAVAQLCAAVRNIELHSNHTLHFALRMEHMGRAGHGRWSNFCGLIVGAAQERLIWCEHGMAGRSKTFMLARRYICEPAVGMELHATSCA